MIFKLMKFPQLRRISGFLALPLLAIGFFHILYSSESDLVKPVEAVDATCPDYMDDYECLDYLQDLAKQLSDEKQKLDSQISQEEYEQLDLYQKISYTYSQIAAREKTIEELEVQLEQKATEIRILNRDIESKQTSLDTIAQEIELIKAKIKKRINMSYKYSSISTFELFLNSNELDNLLRRIQYLKDLKEKDAELLGSMGEQISFLESEQAKLQEKKEEVKKVQLEAEGDRADLFDEKEELASQKSSYQALLSESQRREDEYRTRYDELEAAANQATQQITQLIFELFRSGTIEANTPVEKGDILGFQGFTGFAYGSHLHFEYRVNGVVTNPNINCLHISYGTYASSINCEVPVDGGYVSQFPHEYIGSYYAVDFVSHTSGEQPGSWITVPPISCYGLYRESLPIPTRGTGAPIRAIKDGFVTKVLTDACGGKYVLVDHGNGETSMYLHLR